MKANVPFLFLATIAVSSCVSLGKYENLEAKNRRIQKELNTLRQEMTQMKDENAELIRQNQTLSLGMGEAANARQESDENVRRLTRELENSIHRYDTMSENYQQQISGKERDLDKTSSLLETRTQEMNEQSEAFRKRQQELQESEAAAKAALAAKESALAAKQQELDQIRQSVANALTGFADKGMQVETKDGKVYVSMESKLMFPSGSWKVSDEGDKAIRQLSRVLEANADLNIMVEGHTDTDEYRGMSDIKDNWDLSVMRATAIVKLILHYGPAIDPTRIEAAGHGPYMPKVDNDTPEHKAQNRRTEIILTPKIADILDIIGE